MARRTKEDAEKTYNSLLEAATKVFREQGVSKTTLNEIATEAGVTRGAVYWHFDNKDAVIKALWCRTAGVEFAELKTLLQRLPEENPLGYFVQHLKTIVSKAFTDPCLNQALHIISSSLEFTTRESDLQKFLREQRESLYTTIYKTIENLQKRGVLSDSHPPELITNGLWVFLTGLIRTHIEMGKIDVTREKDLYIEIWLSAFK